ncbi:hypothetical protein B0T16DRAFT_415018 [Cercophora newfieldiana]|uniref:Uncharacterized protein n=1 Tax=Cercophora newfieldiana TaxID=92897 RepID=A0AA39Y044_9PEZI|nr:hypothetical protein B0T16DRAFT_415018 [Cercophora newfieldiana]
MPCGEKGVSVLQLDPHTRHIKGRNHSAGQSPSSCSQNHIHHINNDTKNYPLLTSGLKRNKKSETTMMGLEPTTSVWNPSV